MTPKLKKLEKQADKLFQLRFLENNPNSIISGEPTEVCHHFIPKSQSYNLRYELGNGIALTNKEHCRHHLSGDPSIVATIIFKKGKKWFNDLESRRQIIQKHNLEHINKVIDDLSISKLS